VDRQYVDDRHVVARYLSGQLSEEETRAFEEYMLAHPEIVRELESTAKLKVGLQVLSETGELSHLMRPKPYTASMRYAALAASVAVLALAASFLVRGDAPQAPKLFASISGLVDPAGRLLPMARTYVILRTRGNTYDADVELPASSKAIELRILPEIVAHPARYRVTLARIADDDSTAEVGSIANLVPDDMGFISLYFESSAFTRGRYHLTIRGDIGTDAANAISLFKLKLIPSPGP
jgi:hypothetical protein